MTDPTTPNGGPTGGKPVASATPPVASAPRGAEAAYQSPFTKEAPNGSAQTVSQVLGEIVWLMSTSPIHKQFFISDLEWLVMTPVILQQFRMFYQNASEAQGGQRPIGVVLWARVSEDVEQMLERGTLKMRPHDWKSGDRLWVVEVIAPFGGHDAMVADLKANVFPTEKLKVLALVDGRKVVRVV